VKFKGQCCGLREFFIPKYVGGGLLVKETAASSKVELFIRVGELIQIQLMRQVSKLNSEETPACLKAINASAPNKTINYVRHYYAQKFNFPPAHQRVI